MKLAILIQHVEHVVLFIGDIQIPFVIVNQALWSGDSVFFAKKFRHHAIFGYAEYFVLLTIANQNRAVGSKRDAFSVDESLVFSGHQTSIAASIDFPQTSDIVISEKGVILRVNDKLLRRRDAKARVHKGFQSIRFAPHFESRAALVSDVELSLVPDQTIGRSKAHLVRGKDAR